ncbi:hypothetical protein Ga0074812_12196 [Parafrankia irregularis]|uniref:Uncharacterized protein n=1 Tax=Parafrankia irregularis TaxID=795642 RepID=A0A0S4QUB6_9ACTN|nr:hypothetical protein Ga0074812_12196 [Parafrankia irregularis]
MSAVRVGFALRERGTAKPMPVPLIRRVSGFRCGPWNDQNPQALPGSSGNSEPGPRHTRRVDEDSRIFLLVPSELAEPPHGGHQQGPVDGQPRPRRERRERAPAAGEPVGAH